MSAGQKPWVAAHATHPERCPDEGHPGSTYNPWMDRTWCMCGQVVTDGNTVVQPFVAVCGGSLCTCLPGCTRGRASGDEVES